MQRREEPVASGTMYEMYEDNNSPVIAVTPPMDRLRAGHVWSATSILYTMKKSNPFNSFRLVALVAAMTCSVPLRAQSAAPSAASGQEVTPAGDELNWPREFEDNGAKVDIYQPQIEKWAGADFETRSAVAITAAGSNAPVYGVFWMKARADGDKAARIVTLNDIEVTRAMFPSVPGLQSQYLALIRKHVPTVNKTVALDHLEASYAISE